MDNLRHTLNTLIAWNHRQPDARLAYADAEMITHFDTPPSPWLSLFLIVKGKMTFTVGSCTQTVTRGQLVLLNAHFGNSGIMPGDTGLYACLSFDVGRRRGLDSMSAEPLLMTCGIRDVDYVHSLCKNACALAHTPPAHLPHIQIHAAVLEALTAVYEAIVPPDVTSAPGTSRVVREAMRIIHELHTDPNLDLVRIAERVDVSVGHLMKCFKMEGTGTPIRRLNEFRLARARTLLLRTDSPIREIALATGFRDPLYFSRLFRRSTGQSPTEFRQGDARDCIPYPNGNSATEPQASVTLSLQRRKQEESVPFVNVDMTMDGDIESVAVLADAVSLDRIPAFEHAAWFQVRTQGGIAYLLKTPPTGAKYVSLDLLIGDTRFITFRIRLLTGKQEVWARHVSALTWCQTRIVLKLPSAVDLTNVDRVELIAVRKPTGAMAFCVAPPRFSKEPPRQLDTPALPKGPLLDAMGQFRLLKWQTKALNPNEVTARLHADLATAPKASWPDRFSRFGGDLHSPRVKATGFFRTHHDGQRWWLVDPEGHRFWSAGACCVHPSIDHEVRYETEWMNLRDAIASLPDPTGDYAAAYGNNPWHASTDKELDFVAVNLIRAFGPDHWREHWETLAFATLRRIGINTAGDWSDYEACARAGVPYTRPLELHLRYTHTPPLLGNLPDVFHDGLAKDAATYAEQLHDTVNDPAMVGYFLHNEPHWWFGDGLISPAEQMLREDARGCSREALVAFLQKRYPDDEALRRRWGTAFSFAAVAEGAWAAPFTKGALRDLHAFSTILLKRMIGTLSQACKKVDPNHLNLGVRWWTFPPLWALAAMESVDVITFNCYQAAPDKIHYGSKEVQPGAEKLCTALDKPFMIGEWHIGAMDGGLPSAGLHGVRDQKERGKAYRYYLEQAAALPWCVGTHWFNLYDRNALYCPDANENYNIGFMDLTQRRHETLCRAARKSHERLYDVASGREQPYSANVNYLFPSR